MANPDPHPATRALRGGAPGPAGAPRAPAHRSHAPATGRINGHRSFPEPRGRGPRRLLLGAGALGAMALATWLSGGLGEDVARIEAVAPVAPAAAAVAD